MTKYIRHMLWLCLLFGFFQPSFAAPPEIHQFRITNYGNNSYNFMLGWRVQFKFSMENDDDKAVFEYKAAEGAPWEKIDAIYGQVSTNTGSTIPNSYYWEIPQLDKYITQFMQLRVTVTNQAGESVSQESKVFKVHKNTIKLNKFSLVESRYSSGDLVRFDYDVSSNNPVTFFKVVMEVEGCNSDQVYFHSDLSSTKKRIIGTESFTMDNDSCYRGKEARFIVTVKDSVFAYTHFETSPIQIDSGGDANPSSSFDGAGSLVSPNGDCYGCNRDTAIMHPHERNSSSTVAFQWFYDETSCNRLDIKAEHEVNVVVKSKSWAGLISDEAFRVTLGSDPITVNNNGNLWTTLSVTSVSPILTRNKIDASCLSSDKEFKQGNRVSLVTTDLQDVGRRDYSWTGTGSVITQANRELQGQYGLTKDSAKTSDTANSLTSFQWYPSEECKKLEISDNGTDTLVNADVYMKRWSLADWNEEQCGGELPCTLNAPEVGSYYVIKVISDSNSFHGFLEAKCSN